MQLAPGASELVVQLVVIAKGDEVLAATEVAAIPADAGTDNVSDRVFVVPITTEPKSSGLAELEILAGGVPTPLRLVLMLSELIPLLN